MGASTRRNVLKKFKIRGYTLKVEALEEILSFVIRFQDAESEAIDLILDELENESLKSSTLDKDSVHRVVSLLSDAEAAAEENSQPLNAETFLRVIDVFLAPKFCYDPIKKLFYEHTEKLLIHGDASHKAALYKDRYNLLLQRLSRDEYFSKPVFDSGVSNSGNCEISPIQSLIGRSGRKWVMGVISQLEDGHYYLEDLTAAVEVNLTNAKVTTGLFVENTIVLAEGEMLHDGVFQVRTCGFPPLEDRQVSVKLLAGMDFFGGGILTKEDAEVRPADEMFVVVSDVWLDSEQTIEKLGRVLDGFEGVEAVPSLFIFMGNFCSRPCNLAFPSFSMLRQQFGRFGEMISARKRIREESRFLFVPGPDDAGPSRALPRCGLPTYLTEELQKHIPGAIFSSNPCRIRSYGKDIVIFRHDLLYRMRRLCLMPPTSDETADPFEHLVATMTHQSHLCPLPLTVQPVIWNFDHALTLYPTPHTIILGDRSLQKAFNYTGTTCFNPGSFSNDATFAVYRPSSQEVELSAL